MGARLGIVTGRDLAQSVRDEYPLWLSRLIYMMMELAVIGADIQEVVGSGIAINLISAGMIPVWVGCLITAVDTLTFLAVGHLGVRFLEAHAHLMRISCVSYLMRISCVSCAYLMRPGALPRGSRLHAHRHHVRVLLRQLVGYGTRL